MIVLIAGHALAYETHSPQKDDSLRAAYLGRQSGNQAVTPLADEQIEQGTDEWQQPDNQQPEHLFSAGEVIPQNDEGQDDVADDGH